jgi:hypothetical protein
MSRLLASPGYRFQGKEEQVFQPLTPGWLFIDIFPEFHKYGRAAVSTKQFDLGV